MAVQIGVERKGLHGLQQLLDESLLQRLDEEGGLRVVEQVVEHLGEQHHALRTHLSLHVIHVLHALLPLRSALQQLHKVACVGEQRLADRLGGLGRLERSHLLALAVVDAFGQQRVVLAAQARFLCGQPSSSPPTAGQLRPEHTRQHGEGVAPHVRVFGLEGDLQQPLRRSTRQQVGNQRARGTRSLRLAALSTPPKAYTKTVAR